MNWRGKKRQFRICNHIKKPPFVWLTDKIYTDKENYNIDLHNYQLNENKKELKQSFNSNLVQMAGIVEPRRGNSPQDYFLILLFDSGLYVLA